MGCSCKKKTLVYNNLKVEIFDRNDKPFDACLRCARKHLSLSLVLFDNDKNRSMINLFLAYKHLEKRYAEIAKLIFTLYKELLENKRTFRDILDVVNFFQSSFNDFKESEKETSLNLESELSKDQLFFTFIYGAYEMLFKEFGYQEINKSYAIGYLQLACEIEENTLKKELIRSLWVEEPTEDKFKVLFKEINR